MFVGEDTPKLINPGPLTYQRHFPIPVSMYSDIQQEGFWESGVRNFGHGLFYYRHVQEGVETIFAVTPNVYDKNDDYTWVQGKRSRIGPNPKSMARVTAMNEGVENIKRLSEINNLASLTPEERGLLGFAKELLLGSQVDGEYWVDSVKQRIAVEDIFERLRSYRAHQQHRQDIFDSIVNLVRRVRVNHEVMIAATSSLEEISGTKYTDRRSELLAWNRGMRSFVQEMSKTPPDQSHTMTLFEEKTALELCRMHLWSPEDPIQDVYDFTEMVGLTRARDSPVHGLNVQQCRALCESLIAAPNCSMIVECCAQILLTALDQGDARGWGERNGALQQNVELLRALRWGSGSEWRAFLDSWMELAEQIGARK